MKLDDETSHFFTPSHNDRRSGVQAMRKAPVSHISIID